MGVEYGKDSNYAKEARRWEATHTEFGPPGRPWVYREFPKMLYKAANVDGKIKIADRVTVHTEDEQRNMESRGFVFGPDNAIKAVETEQHLVHGTLAAEREWQIQHGRISEKAVAEVRAAETAVGAVHLPDVPITPIPAHRKRGRPKKAVD